MRLASTSSSTTPASRSRASCSTSPPTTTTRVLDVSLRGTLYMSQAVLPTMRAAKSRLHRLHLVGLRAARRRHPRRAALLGRQGRRAGPGAAMAREFGIDGIRVNCVTPGLIATDINKGLIPDDKQRASWTRSRPTASASRPTSPAASCSWPARSRQVLHRRHARRQRRHVDPRLSVAAGPDASLRPHGAAKSVQGKRAAERVADRTEMMRPRGAT